MPLHTHMLWFCKNMIHWTLDCVHLLNNGGSLIPCVMRVISSISQVCTCYFPSTCCKRKNSERNDRHRSRIHTPPRHAAFSSSLAAICNMELWILTSLLLKSKVCNLSKLWQELGRRETEAKVSFKEKLVFLLELRIWGSGHLPMNELAAVVRQPGSWEMWNSCDLWLWLKDSPVVLMFPSFLDATFLPYFCFVVRCAWWGDSLPRFFPFPLTQECHLVKSLHV